MTLTSVRLAVAGALAATVLLAGCSSPDSVAPQADALEVHEQWIKAADSGMTAAFAELRNTSDSELHVVGASSPVTDYAELHEMAAGADGSMVMRPKEGGFVIPAGETHLLAAGGDHLMLMDLTAPLTPGQDADITVEFEDGSTSTFTAQVRDFAGAQEDYEPGGADMGGMDMGDHAG